MGVHQQAAGDQCSFWPPRWVPAQMRHGLRSKTLLVPPHADTSRAERAPGPAGYALAQAALLQTSRVLVHHLSARHPPAMAVAGEASHHLPGQALHMPKHTQDVPRQNTAIPESTLMC